MGHPIHKHMNGGMSRASSAEKYDAKEAYNKDLTSKARMHYLENDIADKKGMSRQASPLNGFNSYTSDTHKHPHAEGTSRKSSPANYETAKQERINLNTENPIKNASCKYKK